MLRLFLEMMNTNLSALTTKHIKPIAPRRRTIQLIGLQSLVLLLPSLAVGARRLHDIGRSGWWQLLIFTVIEIIPLIVWWASDTSPTDNKYGKPTRQI